MPTPAANGRPGGHTDQGGDTGGGIGVMGNVLESDPKLSWADMDSLKWRFNHRAVTNNTGTLK